MTKIRIQKIAGVAAGAALAFGAFVPMVGAQTIAELQAQINALMAQLATLQGGSAPASVTFTQNLTLGSTGAEVSSLQQYLVAQGHLVMPAGVAFGYFGPLTQAAVAKWQAANGVAPAVGYWGSISRARYVAVAGSTPGTTTGGGTVTNVGGGITTPGVEGTITVTSSPVSTGSVYEGDKMVPVLAFKARAQNSDILVQRVKLDLGTLTTIYNKIYEKVYLVDESGNVLASADLNSSTVVDEGTNYFITLSGFNYLVPKETTKIFTVKMDVRTSIDSADIDTETFTVRVAADGVRGIDGVGVNQYSPTLATEATKTLSISTSLLDAASLILSTNTLSPLTQEVVAADGSNDNEKDKVTLLIFNVRAEKDDVLLTDLVATVTRANGAATASSTFLYVGDTAIGSASAAVGGATTFNDIDYNIPKNTTKTFTLKADVRNASSVQTTIAASIANSGLTAENSIGDNVQSVSGSATGNSILVTSIGPVFSLVGTPTISKTETPIQNNYSTSTLSATFQLRIEAVGGDILFGTNASGTPMVSNVTVAGNKSFGIYLGGALNTQVTASSTSFTFPSVGSVVTTGSDSVTLSEGSAITMPITFTYQGNLSTGVGVTNGSYAVGIERINWVGVDAGTLSASTFMAGQTDWRTAGVSLP